jgi:PPOX class probable F420-dependent enzyme
MGKLASSLAAEETYSFKRRQQENTMSAKIPERLLSLLAPETKSYAFLALVKSDGTPQVTPVWFDYDGTHLIVNTARGRVKDRILHKHPVVAVAIADPGSPYEYLQVTGRVAEETEEGAHEVINALSLKYTGKREYPLKEGEVRVTYKILVEKVQPQE